MRSVELFIGTNRTGKSPIAEPDALASIFAELRAIGVEGATLTSGWGYCRGEVERFIVVYLGNCEEDDIETFAYRIGEAFGQDAIGWREASPIQLAWKLGDLGRQPLFRVVQPAAA